MHYITIGLLATVIMDQYWIPMPTGLHIFANVLCFGATAVSYTHLDVYKRQALNGISDPDKINAGDTIRISGTASDPAPAGDDWIRQLQHQLNVQFSAGLAEDGIAGPKTLAACITCRPGARGEITRLIQSKVGTTADGIWGNNTTADVYKRQMQGIRSTRRTVNCGYIGKMQK